MHWVVGRRRAQHGSAVHAARTTARSTRYATALGLIGTLASVGFGIAAEVTSDDIPEVWICTAIAIQDYHYLYETGDISQEEFEQLRADAIADQLADVGDCQSGRGPL
jgi:hypothetical protein